MRYNNNQYCPYKAKLRKYIYIYIYTYKEKYEKLNVIVLHEYKLMLTVLRKFITIETSELATLQHSI